MRANESKMVHPEPLFGIGQPVRILNREDVKGTVTERELRPALHHGQRSEWHYTTSWGSSYPEYGLRAVSPEAIRAEAAVTALQYAPVSLTERERIVLMQITQEALKVSDGGWGGPLICGVQNPDYPGEYFCTYPGGHGKITDEENDIHEMDHGAPASGAWWSMPEEPTSGPVFRDEASGALGAVLAFTQRWLDKNANHNTEATDVILLLRDTLLMSTVSPEPPEAEESHHTLRWVFPWTEALAGYSKIVRGHKQWCGGLAEHEPHTYQMGRDRVAYVDVECPGTSGWEKPIAHPTIPRT